MLQPGQFTHSSSTVHHLSHLCCIHIPLLDAFQVHLPWWNHDSLPPLPSSPCISQLRNDLSLLPTLMTLLQSFLRQLEHLPWCYLYVPISSIICTGSSFFLILFSPQLYFDIIDWKVSWKGVETNIYWIPTVYHTLWHCVSQGLVNCKCSVNICWESRLVFVTPFCLKSTNAALWVFTIKSNASRGQYRSMWSGPCLLLQPHLVLLCPYSLWSILSALLSVPETHQALFSPQGLCRYCSFLPGIAFPLLFVCLGPSHASSLSVHAIFAKKTSF